MSRPLSQGGTLQTASEVSALTQAIKLPRRRERPSAAIAGLTVDQVMAAPPTVGAISATSSFAAGTFKDWLSLKPGIIGAGAVDTAAPFDYVGVSGARQQGSTSPLWNYVVFDSPSHPNAQSAPMRTRFYFDGTNLEIYFSQLANFPYQVYVDGQAIASAPYVSGTNQTVAYWPITFPTRAPRLIEFVTANPFGGVRTAVTDTIWKPATVGGARCIILGDSYTAGAGSDASGITGWAQKFAAIMGWPDTWGAGVGGSGFLNPGQGTTFRSRVAADITANNPDIVIVAGGHNDTSYTTAAVQAEASLLFAAIKAGSPNAKLIVVGPMGAANAQGTYPALQAAIFAAAAGIADLIIDTLTPNWFTGLGSIGTRRSVTDAVTNSTTTITSATAAFTSGDVGYIVAGSGIPAGTKISSVTNSTTAVLSTSATASASGVTFTLTNQRGDGNDDNYIWTDNVHPSQAGHSYLARRIASPITAWLGS